jgi:UDP-glucose 4-epimerase
MSRTILVTGAAGKVGQNFINHFFNNPKFKDDKIVALCHNRMVEENEQIKAIKGNIANEEDVQRAMEGVTHVIHLATCKEIPKDVMDITVKGLFWVLETCRKSKTFEQFVLLGGDAGIGHCVYPNSKPLTEDYPHRAYEGCYALSKVLEEAMLQQYYIQYDLNGCCLRAPWIMEKDDFEKSMSFGDDIFGGPAWSEYVASDKAKEYYDKKTVPVMLDSEGSSIKRNFVHVSDLVKAIGIAIDHPKARQQLFNICMNDPVDYRKVADHLKETKGLDSVDIKTEFHSNWLDNSKARFLLDWNPEYDYKRLTDEAYGYKRDGSDPRVIYYPG